MKVSVKLFANLAVFGPPADLPGRPFEVELPEGGSLNELVHHLKLPAEQVKILFVNGITQPGEWILKAGDEIGIFPPIGGG